MTNSADTFNALYVAATEVYESFQGPLDALTAAHDNAQDMIREGTMTEFYADTMASLESVLAFEEDAAVRRWFTERGVRF
jgi:formate hydrogenlyase subunit 4